MSTIGIFIFPLLVAVRCQLATPLIEELDAKRNQKLLDAAAFSCYLSSPWAAQSCPALKAILLKGGRHMAYHASSAMRHADASSLVDGVNKEKRP